MKTAGTRNCQLCMQERVALFYAFHKKKTQTHNLMNSRTEMYGACTCKTRFSWLHAVGNEGADEATTKLVAKTYLPGENIPSLWK